MRGVTIALMAASLALAAGVQGAEAKGACALGKPETQAELYFGLSVRGAPDLTDEQFADFLDREVSTRFPDGLTVLSAQGRWRSTETGQMVKEPSKLVRIILSGKADDLAKLDAVRDAYKRQYHQEAVLEVLSRTCAAF